MIALPNPVEGRMSTSEIVRARTRAVERNAMMLRTARRLLAALMIVGLTSLWHGSALAEDGYDLWLRYRPVEASMVNRYHARLQSLVPGAPRRR
jgi:hypothetical protein